MFKSVLKTTLVAFLLSFYFSANAQSIVIDGVDKKGFEGLKTIRTAGTDEESVEGYYFTYIANKQKKGMREYQITMLDKDLSNKRTASIEIHKRADITQTVFNGTVFITVVSDYKNRTYIYYIFDKQGKRLKTDNIPYGSYVYPGDENGFYMVTNSISSPKSKKISGFSVRKVNNDLGTVWSKSFFPEGKKGYQSLTDLNVQEGKVIGWMEKGPSFSSDKISPAILALDDASGRKVFQKDGYDGTSTILYSDIKIDKSGSILLGGAYVDGIKYRAANNDGIYFMRLDKNGKELSYSKVPVKGPIQKALKAATKGFTISSKTKILIEDIVEVDGRYFLVSEMFRKNTSLTPPIIQGTRDAITGKYIGSIGASSNSDNSNKPAIIQIMDFALFEFDATGEYKEISIIPKDEYNKISAYYPYNGLSGMSLARVVRRKGFFDYSFSLTDPSTNDKIMVTNDNSSVKPRVTLYNIQQGKKIRELNLKALAKIELDEKKKVSTFNVLRNEKGNIALGFYQKKLDRMTITIESVE